MSTNSAIIKQGTTPQATHTHLMQMLKEMHSQLKPPTRDPSGIPLKSRITQAQELNLTSAIEQLKGDHSRPSLEQWEQGQHHITKTELLEEMYRLNDELEESFEYMQHTLQKETEHLKKQQKFLEERMMLNQGIQDLLQRKNSQTVSKSKEQLRDKISTLEDSNQQLSMMLIAFLDEYYPIPDLSDASKKEKKRKVGSGDMFPEAGLSLKELLKQIIEKSQLEDDPYVKLNAEEHHEPYVELLLRAGIAQKHPQDNLCIKLVNLF